MSGGRYNHLYRQEPDELLGLGRVEDLTAIRDRLIELGASDIATEVDEILSAITAFQEKAGRQMTKLGDVLQAVEWLDSNDWDEDQVKEVIGRFRASHD
ncbi:hypothetical protein [Nocardia carnea]|uniref:hypothetical protein n=1 Tax=Nocardia carnea TaxID=37328 RepID=UPI002454673B|nr:hypothetical protein [Nocardia carnea]